MGLCICSAHDEDELAICKDFHQVHFKWREYSESTNWCELAFCLRFVQGRLKCHKMGSCHPYDFFDITFHYPNSALQCRSTRSSWPLYLLLLFMAFYLRSITFTCFVSLPQVRATVEKYPPYQAIFAKLSFGESQMLDKAFYEEEVKRLTLVFDQQVSGCHHCFVAAIAGRL